MSKKNKSPEAEVVKDLKRFFKYKHPDFFDIHVIEAKANYSEKTGRYMHGAVAPGYPDMSGNDKFGNALFIEVKAKGKLSTLRPDQYFFLTRKIELNCFAVCVDSVDMFIQVYKTWLSLESTQRQQYLLSQLKPNKKLREIIEEDSQPLFPEG